MVKPSHITVVAIMAVSVCSTLPAKPNAGPLNPIRTTTQRSGYSIDTVGDTLGQASAQNTRIIIRIVGPDKKLVKPASVILVDKAGAAIKPVFREDRKVGHEENTGLPVSMAQGGVALDLGKMFGPRGSYAYTKVDWPKSVFTGDKNLQITLSNGQSLVLPLTTIAK